MKQIFFICLLIILTFSKRIELEGKQQVLNGWVKSEKADPHDNISLLFALKHTNLAKSLEMFMRVSDPKHKDYGKHLTWKQSGSLVEPKQENIEKLISFLKSNGIDEYHLSDHKDFVKVETTVSKGEKMLETSFHKYKNINLKKVLIRAEKYSVPEELGEVLHFVGGVKRLPRVKKMKIDRKDTRLGKRAYVVPQTIRNTFNISVTGNPNNKNQQAVAQFLQQYYNPGDLSSFLTSQNIPNIKVYKEVGPNNANNVGVEAQLDIEYIIGVNQGTKTWFVSTGGEHDQQEPFLTWLYGLENTTDLPYVHSVSYGDVEDSLDISFMEAVNVQFIKLGLAGITIVFASGDDGVGCNGGCTKFLPNFPASSPYVLASGGISTVGRGDTISSGGFSNTFSRFGFQDGVVSNYLKLPGIPSTSFFNSTGRAIPDVASFSESVLVTYEGNDIAVGGTSCAAPVISAMLTLLNDVRLNAGKSTLGFVAPLLYSIQANSTLAFSDITQGSNPNSCCPGFPCKVGWDAVTGLGVFNFGVLSTLI